MRNNWLVKEDMTIMILLHLYMISIYTTKAFSFETYKEMAQRQLREAACEAMQLQHSFTSSLRFVCHQDPFVFGLGINGFKYGLQQCQSTFRKERWNCTTISGVQNHSLFGVVLARASREAAVMFAMISAGMVQWITTQNYNGKIQGSERHCHCDADTKLGEFYARQILENWLDSQRMSKHERMMNRHNAAVGRLAVTEEMENICRCVGVSGSCSTKSCYKILHPLRVIASRLKNKYTDARKVKPSSRPKRDGTNNLVLIDNNIEPDNTDLIYISDSPSYCHFDNSTMSLGTSGRICNASSLENDSCNTMCCARGYHTHKVTETKYCNCKFNWCCEVQCDECSEERIFHRCK